MKATGCGRAWKEGRSARGAGAIRWIAFAAVFALSYAVFYALVLRGSSDLSIHATWAAEGDFLRPRTFLRHGAHPLWHGLVAAVMLTGVGVKVAAALVTAVLKTLEYWLMRRLMAEALRGWAGEITITLAAACCALVTALWTPWNPGVYLGVGSPNTWHSPTQMAAMVAMLLCVPYAARCYAVFERLVPSMGEKAVIPRREALMLSLLLLGSLFAKPIFMQVFLPAAGVFLMAGWHRYRANARFFGQMLLAALPAVLMMVFQYLYYFGMIVPSQGSMTLEISWEKLGRVLLSTVLIQAFPLYALFACARRRDFGKPLLTLAVLMDAVGVLEYLFLGENGRRAADGNFGWGMMGGALMLWVTVLPLFLRSFARARQEGGGVARHWPGFGLLAWHLGSGVYYIVYLLTSGKAL